jgi:hypothetical protein
VCITWLGSVYSFHGSLEFGGLDSRNCIIRVQKLLIRLNVSHVFVPGAPLASFSLGYYPPPRFAARISLVARISLAASRGCESWTFKIASKSAKW